MNPPPAQNRLEELLAAAAEDEQARTAFYEELLRSDLFGVVRIEGDVDQVDRYRARVAEGGGVKLLPLDLGGETVFALFTSAVRLEQATGGGLPFASVPSEAVFRQLPPGERVVLNPGVWYGKELLPDEIQELAAGRVPGAASGPTTVAPGDDVMLGLPAESPDGLVEALRAHFTAARLVTSARLGQMYLPESAVPPHPVVGIEVADGSTLEDALAEVDPVVRDSHDGPVDFVPLAGNEIGAWLRDNVAPFYERSRDGG